jgi:hypothetical protein
VIPPGVTTVRVTDTIAFTVTDTTTITNAATTTTNNNSTAAGTIRQQQHSADGTNSGRVLRSVVARECESVRLQQSVRAVDVRLHEVVDHACDRGTLDDDVHVVPRHAGLRCPLRQRHRVIRNVRKVLHV